MLSMYEPHIGDSLELFSLTLTLLNFCTQPLVFINLDTHTTIIVHHQPTPILHKDTHPHL